MFFLSSLRNLLIGTPVVIVKLLLLMKSIIFMVFLLINYKRVAFYQLLLKFVIIFEFLLFDLKSCFFIVGRIVRTVLYVVLFEKSFHVIRSLVSHVVLYHFGQSTDCCFSL
jgi:hypothetical protein